MNDTDLEDRLRRHARATRQDPPSLADHLNTVDQTAGRTNRTRLLAMAAAVLVIGGVAVGVSLVRDGRHATPSAHSSATSSSPSPSATLKDPSGQVTGPTPAPTVVRNSTVLVFSKTMPWERPILDGQARNVVTLLARADNYQQFCVTRVVAETDGSVRIAVDSYVVPKSGGSGEEPPHNDPSAIQATVCFDEQTAVLSRPLGTRTVIDDAAGVKRTVIDAAGIPGPPQAPTGFSGGRPNAELDDKTSLGYRQYVDEGAKTDQLIDIYVNTGSEPTVRGSVVDRVDVNGHQAVVSKDTDPDIVTVSWIQDGRVITVQRVMGGDPPRAPSTPDEMVAFARSLR